MKIAASKIYLTIAAVLSFVVSYWLPMDQYVREIVLTIGINIILAVSLNLVNGFTGQFSLGHAGFMAIGAYLSAAVTTFWAPRLLGVSIDTTTGLTGALVFLCALLAGAFAAVLFALAGIVVTGLALICTVVPTAEVHSVWQFEAKIAAITIVLVVSARILYNRSRRAPR